MGSDVAGVVEALGEDVTSPAVGDEVLGQSVGPSYATAALARADALVPKPPEVPWEVAGALGAAAGTAFITLEKLRVGGGDSLLVHAAAGGVGTMAVQLAVLRGARVIGMAGEANHERLRSYGAVPVLYGDGWAERVREVAPDGVDAVLDASGRSGELPLSVELAGGPERVLTIAAFQDVPEGVMVHQGGGAGDTGRALREVVPLVAEGRVDLPIAKTFPLEEAAEALEQSGRPAPAARSSCSHPEDAVAHGLERGVARRRRARSASTSRVSRGSITPSSHSRAVE